MYQHTGNRILYLLRRFKSDCPKKCTVTREMLKYLQCRKDVKLDMCIIDDNMIDPCWDPPEIVIVGAGIAGLSAGQRLAFSGINKFTIVEATHRAGGRIHSSYFGNVPVEIGATFIEGGSLSNVAFTLASQESLISKPPICQDPSAGICMTSDGYDIPFYMAKAAQECFHGIVSRAADLYITEKKAEDCGTLRKYLEKEMDFELQAFPSIYRDVAGRVMTSEAIALKNKLGSTLGAVSAKHFGSYAELSGGRIRVATGMIGILAPLLRNMPECESIRYCKPVSQIHWSAKGFEESSGDGKSKRKPRAKVICCDGHVLTADYVIITLPLGCLQKNMDSMFVPALPKVKQQALKRLGYGHINHVYFEYNKPFWIWREGCIRPCWAMDELAEDNWVKGIAAIEEVPSSQQILYVTLSDNAAKCVEQLSEVKLAEDFTAMLRKLLDDPTLPYPANVLRTKWTSCPYSAGAKTFIKYGSSVSDICDYIRTVPDQCGPEVPVLLFAGEGTAIGAYGTLHGARMSGIREAERIINYTKKFQGRPGEKHPESVCEEKAMKA